MSRKTYKLFPSDLPPPGCEDYVGSNEANNVHFTNNISISRQKVP